MDITMSFTVNLEWLSFYGKTYTKQNISWSGILIIKYETSNSKVFTKKKFTGSIVLRRKFILSIYLIYVYTSHVCLCLGWGAACVFSVTLTSLYDRTG